MNPRARLVFAAALALAGSALAADNDLPRRQAGDRPEPEVALIPKDIGDVLPGKELPTFELMAPEPAMDVERAKSDLDRAQRKQQRWEKLCKAGVIAKVEAEACVLATARARARYEKARVADQERALEELRQRAAGGQVDADAVKAAESALQTAQTMAAEADAGLRRTELLFAEANVDRQRRLLAAGAGSRNLVQRAENTLAQLKRAAP